MILDGMTGIEILEELEKYSKRIDDFIRSTLKSKEKEIRRRFRKRPKDSVDFKTRTLTFPDQKFYIVLYPWIMKKTNGLGVDYSLYTIIRNKYSGKKMILYFPTLDEDNKDYIIIYENHLLKRYRERFLGLGPEEIDFETLADKFIRDNRTTTVNNNNGNLEGRMLNGVILGNYQDEYTVRFKTFIAEDMLRDYQEHLLTYSLDTLIEKIEDNEVNKKIKINDNITIKTSIL